MAELEIDQSNLPRVQEVCQSFAVLEDGALAHNLQEQEIEQYYTTNIQKNQLVQNDIRVAKRMQDEEEEQQAQQSALLRQASRQIEERDLEYARVIQEELRQCAEEAHRREQDDAEMAKRLQEEEEQWVRRRSRGQEGHNEGSTSEPLLQTPHQHMLSTLHQTEEEHSSSTTRGQSFASNSGSQFSEPGTGPPRRPSGKNYRNGSKNEFKGWEEEDEEEEEGVWNEDTFENNNLQTRKPRHLDEKRNHRKVSEDRHRSREHNTDSRSIELGERRHSRSESLRVNDRSRYRNEDLARTWSYKENPDKHVRFKDDNRSYYRQQGESNRVWEMLGLILRERGVPVRVGGTGAPLQIRPQSRDNQVLHGCEGSCGNSRPHQRGFQRAATTRHSFHGDIRERRRLSRRENSGRDHREDPDRRYDSGEVYKLNGAAPEPEANKASLDLGELHQVLRDEELARTLQQEEEKLLRRNSQSSPCGFYPEGDFRVAQVAQDEEIARFMQKQEIKSKRRSRELEGPASWREHRVMISHHDRQAARERQVQRERLDSEGLPSPTEDFPPEIQPPSPISTTPKAMKIRNIAEELDPTFQARRQSTEGLRVGPAGPACGSAPLHSGLHDFLEEPTFIPPTKRQTDKSGHTKPKEKKENCKQQ
ncbi:coiled-coil domain-containing protein 187 [Xenentodon cancila]